jgi:hypothetical protein
MDENINHFDNFTIIYSVSWEIFLNKMLENKKKYETDFNKM